MLQQTLRRMIKTKEGTRLPQRFSNAKSKRDTKSPPKDKHATPSASFGRSCKQYQAMAVIVSSESASICRLTYGSGGTYHPYAGSV